MTKRRVRFVYGAVGACLALAACAPIGAKEEGRQAPPAPVVTPTAPVTAVPSSTDAGVEAAGDGGGVGAATGDVQKDISTWALPLDPWLDERNQAVAFEIWVRLLVRCINDKSVAYTRNYDSSAPFPEDAPGGNLADRLFTVEIAQKYGYRPAPNPQDPWTEEQLRAGDGLVGRPEVRRAWDQCIPTAEREFEERFGEKRPTAYERLPGRGELNRMGPDMESAEAVAAAQRWRECMAPLGIPDLPEQPFAKTRYHIPETLQQRWDWYSGGLPSAEEIEYAVHDAQCRASSGWDQTLYEDQWAQQEAFVNAHRAELDAVAQQWERDAVRLRALLAEVQAEK
ncbi:hypothetical protein [Buchananella felis]|uniref:hypothetical protein n=1 Tax=Buchananella felis TaxID=3231492 RepID=UPI003528A54B